MRSRLHAFVALGLQGAWVAFLGWLYWGDAARALFMSHGPVACTTQWPSWPLVLVGAVLALAALLEWGARLVEREGLLGHWRGLVWLAGFLLVFFDFAVLSASRSPLIAADEVTVAIQALADAASAQSTLQSVPRAPEALESLVADLPVPLFLSGRRVPHWKVEVRERCSGPAADARSAEAGTLIYCVATDHRQAWVTAVATEGAEPWGSAAVAGTEGRWVAQVSTPVEASEEAPSVWDSLTPEDEGEGGSSGGPQP